MAEFYLDERQRKKRRRLMRLKIYGGVAVFLLLIIGALYVIIYSPLFQITRIDLPVRQAGADSDAIDAGRLIQDLKTFFVSQSKIASFLGSDNILIWDIKKTDQFPKNSEIANLTIEKDYFERTIKINIKVRERFGIWCAQASCSWFDKNGVIFSSAPLVEGNLINKVDDFSGRHLKTGDLVLEERFIPNLIEIFDVLEKSDLGTKSLKLERLELQEILTESSPIIYFSLRIDPGFALAVFKSLEADTLDKIEYIDLRVENRAYYKPK